MSIIKRVIFLTLAMSCSVFAQSTSPSHDHLLDEITALKDQLGDQGDLIDAQQTQIRQLMRQVSGQSQQNWLNERRAEEIKTLIREVLQDADTRASLRDDGMTAGHNGQNFFLASEDGSFALRIQGLLQGRFLFNRRKESPPTLGNGGDGADDIESGFEIARTKLEFSGHIGSPAVQYLIRIGVDREDNEVLGERVVIGYQIIEDGIVDDAGQRYGGLTIWGGEDKAPFLREEITGPAQQLAVDRTLMNEVFTAGYVQGMWVTWNALEFMSIAVSINDGFRSGEADNENNSANVVVTSPSPVHKPFFSDRTDFAITTRVDLKLTGTWGQYADFSAWSGEPLAIFLGGALHYEIGESGSNKAVEDDDFLVWTIDGAVEVDGLNIFAAFAGFHSSVDSDVVNTTGNNLDMYGFVIQGGYMIIPDKLEPFVRFEWIDLDGTATTGDADQVNLITFGANYYLTRHRAKFTLDVVWALSEIPDSSAMGLQDNGANDPSLGAIGLRQDAAGSDDQVAIRAQFQVLF